MFEYLKKLFVWLFESMRSSISNAFSYIKDLFWKTEEKDVEIETPEPTRFRDDMALLSEENSQRRTFARTLTREKPRFFDDNELAEAASAVNYNETYWRTFQVAYKEELEKEKKRDIEAKKLRKQHEAMQRKQAVYNRLRADTYRAIVTQEGENLTERQKNEIGKLLGTDIPCFTTAIANEFFNEINNHSQVGYYYRDVMFNVIGNRLQLPKDARFLGPVVYNSETTKKIDSTDSTQNMLYNFFRMHLDPAAYKTVPAQIGNLPVLEGHKLPDDCEEIQRIANLGRDIVTHGKTLILPINFGGSTHWNIAIIDVEEKKIFYFEPFGTNKNNPQLQYLINEFKRQGFEFEGFVNEVKVQHDGSNCGAFSLEIGRGFLANATTNLTDLRENGFTKENITRFLHAAIGTDTAKEVATILVDDGDRDLSNNMGQILRNAHVKIGKEIEMDIISVLHPNAREQIARA